MTTNQTERVSDEELDQMIWKLERDGMTPKQLSLMRELREVRRAKGEPVAWMYEGEDGREYNGHNEFSGGGKGVPLYAAPSAAVVPDTFMPKNLDRALGVVGVALPESKEEFNFQIERWTQRLIERVIRYADEFQEPPAPVVPDLKELEDILDWILMLPCPTPKATHFAMRLAVVIEACRASMLQSDGTLTNEGTMQPSGNSEQLEPVSNSDELPLDYLQGHKDGLEWAAQLAEANHPQTGDWLYDDPIELARAIRKGPDMPTVQDGNSPVTPDGWIPVSERMPDPKSELRVCVYTPNPHEDIRYRFVPASLFKAVCRDATHWNYMSAPKEVG